MHFRLLPENDSVSELYTTSSQHHPGDSGFDLFFPEDINIEAGETKIIDLKIKCEAWKNSGNSETYSYYLYPRSSISKTPLRMANSIGIIDAGYRGNLKVACWNTSSDPYQVERGQRLFQICGPTLSTNNTSEIVNRLSDTERGEGGFGSTD